MLNDVHASSSYPTTTGGRPRVVSIVAVEGYDDSALLALAASVARNLETPVAAAIVDSAREREIQIPPVDQVHHAAAEGLVGAVAGHTVLVGDAAVFSSLGLSRAHLGDWPERLRQRREHVLFVAVDGRTAGFLGITDAGSKHLLT